jgi:MFS family permease
MSPLLRQRIALSAIFFQTGIIFSTWASRIPDIKEKFDLDDNDLGALLLIKPIGSFIGLPLAGWAVDHYGSRPAVGIGIFLYSTCLTLIALAPSVLWLGVVLLFFGMSGNLLNVSLNTQGLTIQKGYGRVVMASFHGLWSLAGFCGAGMAMGAIALRFSLLLHFMLATGVVILMLVICYGYLNREHVRTGSGRFSFKKPDKSLLQLGAVAFCGLVAEGCMFDWSGVYFKDVIGVQGSMVPAGFIAFMSMMATGRFVSDAFTNRFGTHLILKVSGVLIGTGLLVAVAFPALPTGIAGFFLVGLGTSSVIPLTYSEVGKSLNLTPGKAIATVSTLGYFGFLLGPPMIGFVSEAFNLRVSFALVALAGLCISLIISYTQRKKPEEKILLEEQPPLSDLS